MLENTTIEKSRKKIMKKQNKKRKMTKKQVEMYNVFDDENYNW